MEGGYQTGMAFKEGDLVIQRDWHQALPTDLGLGKVIEKIEKYDDAQVRVAWTIGGLIYEWPASIKRVPPLVALAMMAPDA